MHPRRKRRQEHLKRVAEAEERFNQEKSADLQVATEVQQYYGDPLGFTYFAYPWGQNELVNLEGPRTWQADFLGELGEEVCKRGFAGVIPVPPIRFATRSGHGPGKSALVGMIVNWLLSTRPLCQGVVTATTAPQLRTKTWAEIVRWTRLSVTHYWWHITASSANMQIAHEGHREDWKVIGLTCAAENSEAFAGLHAAASSPFYIFDESAGVPDPIWEVAEGGLTDGEPMFFVFGNMTRARGRFHACFYGRIKDRWIRRTIDSRSVPETNKKVIEEWVQDYGEDSDFVRVRVKGLPPKHGDLQLISRGTVEEAQFRPDATVERWEPLIMGVDVSRSAKGNKIDGTAREGAHRPAKTVIRLRRGRDARSWEKVVIRERAQDSEYVIKRVAGLINLYKPDACNVDGDGIGGPICDVLKARGFHQVNEIRGNAAPMDHRFANLRTEMWWTMAKWLREGGTIDAGDEDLAEDLTGPSSGPGTRGREQLESKQQMLARDIASPDDADALALTFAVPVGARNAPDVGIDSTHQSEYDPLATSVAE